MKEGITHKSKTKPNNCHRHVVPATEPGSSLSKQTHIGDTATMKKPNEPKIGSIYLCGQEP